jgi:hypothetical protein
LVADEGIARAGPRHRLTFIVMVYRLVQRLVLVAILASALGCAGDGPAGQGSEQWFDRVQKEIFNQSCISGPCHNPQSVAGDLILTEGFSFDLLVEVPPANEVADSNGQDRVSPFSLDASFLMNKVTGPGPGEGSQMPQGAAPLSESEIELLENWILAGAPRADGTLIGTPTLVPSRATAVPTPTSTATPEPATPTLTATAEPTTTEPPPTMPGETATVPPSPTPTIASVTFDQLQDEIFTPRCATDFCHSAQARIGGLNLAEGDSYDDLVEVQPVNTAAVDRGLLRVDPFDAGNSFLYVKVIDPDTANGEGVRMPMVGELLNDEEIAMIESWIDAGAPR